MTQVQDMEMVMCNHEKVRYRRCADGCCEWIAECAKCGVDV